MKADDGARDCWVTTGAALDGVGVEDFCAVLFLLLPFGSDLETPSLTMLSPPALWPLAESLFSGILARDTALACCDGFFSICTEDFVVAGVASLFVVDCSGCVVEALVMDGCDDCDAFEFLGFFLMPGLARAIFLPNLSAADTVAGLQLVLFWVEGRDFPLRLKRFFFFFPSVDRAASISAIMPPAGVDVLDLDPGTAGLDLSTVLVFLNVEPRRIAASKSPPPAAPLRPFFLPFLPTGVFAILFAGGGGGMGSPAPCGGGGGSDASVDDVTDVVALNFPTTAGGGGVALSSPTIDGGGGGGVEEVSSFDWLTEGGSSSSSESLSGGGGGVSRSASPDAAAACRVLVVDDCFFFLLVVFVACFVRCSSAAFFFKANLARFSARIFSFLS